MKTREMAYSIISIMTILVFFLILAPFTASADSLIVTEERITTSGSASSPEIYGDKIVWEDSRGRKSDIYMYDLSTQQETQISTSGTAKCPEIYEDRIFWKDNCDGKSYIYMYNLSTSEKTQITTIGQQSVLAIYGNRIVWDELINDNCNVYMYDLSTNKEIQITNNWNAWQRLTASVRAVLKEIRNVNDWTEYPAIYDDKIIWEQVNIGTVWGNIYSKRSDVYMYNLSTDKTTRIITAEAPNYHAAIYGDKIVWHSWTLGASDIYVYDLFTDKNTQLTNNQLAQSPDIYEDRVVWEDVRNKDNFDIYMYNLSTSKETQITTDNSDQRSPDIYGDKIVWNERNDIYMGTITYVGTILKTPHAANFTSNVIMGYSPLAVQFTDLSQNATGWHWDFGDGATSIEQRPVHTYSVAGDYTVNLTVTNGNLIDSKTATISVLQSIPPVSEKQFAYITNQGSGTVSVIDLAAKTITATIPVGDGPSGVAVNPEGTIVYVTNSGNNTVSVIDTANNTITSTVNVGNAPYGVAVSPDGKTVYVTNLNDNSVSVINTETNQVVYTIPVGKWPEGVAFTPDGEKAYVANYYSYRTISVIDTATNTVTSMVNDPHIYGPSGIVISPNGKKAYVTSNFNDNLVVIDTASNQVMATVNVKSGPHGVAVSPDGTRVYVVNGEENTVSVVDTAKDEVIATIPVGNGPYGVAVSPDGKTVYVTNRQSNDVSMIDATTNKVIATLPVEANPASFGQFTGFIP